MNGPGLTDPVEVLARTLYGEARGEPKQGIEAVANVILNRVMSNRYPNTVAKVCLQRLQFSCWNDDDPNRKIIAKLMPGQDEIFDMILKIAASAVLGGLPAVVIGVLHYHAKQIRPNWVKKSPGATLVATIGSHLFWSGIR
jgi:spore germination cell wall hydrolase CwlJ-like protein